MNPYSEAERQEAMLGACYAAVQEHFSHLAMRDIIDPPRAWMDAKLARQCAIYILLTDFNLPRNRVAKILRRRRGSIGDARAKIRRRCTTRETFAAVQNAMGLRAKHIFITALHAASERANAA